VKEKPYMSSQDLLEWLKIGCLAGEAKVAAEETKKHAKTDKEKDWAKRMAIAATNLSKVTDERLECMDAMQVASVQRRHEHSSLQLYTSDKLRVDGRTKPERDDVTISYQDWCFLGEMALMHCEMCPQGKYVKDCEYRQTYHRVGIPVAREEVKEGECEFCMDNYMQIVLPQGHTDRDNKIREMVQMYVKNAELADEVKKNAENDKRLFL
jgi:hypothetical protein